MRFDSIIFDLDGTLWDMSAACVKSYNRVVKRNEIPFREVTSDDLRKVVGRPHDECIDEIFSGLKHHGILIKNLHKDHTPLADCLRVTVGTPDENQQFVAALRQVI